MTKNGIRTSKKLASDASRALRNNEVTELTRKLAAGTMGNRAPTTSKLKGKSKKNK